MVKVFVDNRLRINCDDVPSDMLKELKDALTYKNQVYYKNKAMRYGTKGIPEFITSYNINSKKEMDISRGASYKIKEVAKNHDIKLEFIDNRLALPYEFHTTIKLRDYQRKPCDMLVRLQTGLIEGTTGCGKTIILLKAIEEIGQKTIIIVHEAKLQNQWVKHIANYFGIEEKEIGLIGGISKGKNTVKPITVALQQSLLRSSDKYKNEFGCVVCDEVHHYAASTFQEVVDKFPAKYRIGATATPERKDGKHFLVFDQFGKIVSRITNDDLVQMGMVHEVKVVIVHTEFEPKKSIEIQKFKEVVGLDENGNAIIEDIEKETINRHVLLEEMILDKDRNSLIYKFIEAEVNKKNFCILLSDRRRFCHNWQRWLSNKNIESKLLVGGQEYKQEGEEAIRRIIEDGDLHVVIGTTVADEGLDIQRLNRGFSATPTATNKSRITQQVGRIKRIYDGKDDAIWYYFLDKNIKGFDQHEKLLKKYFNNVEVLSDKYQIDEYLHHLANGR